MVITGAHLYDVMFEKMTFLEIIDMYLMIFDTKNIFLVRLNQYSIKTHQY